MTCLNIALIIFLAATSGGVIGIKSWNLDLEKGQIVVEKAIKTQISVCGNLLLNTSMSPRWRGPLAWGQYAEVARIFSQIHLKGSVNVWWKPTKRSVNE